MRLLQTSTLRLESFTDQSQAPPYAILSHMWFGDEVLFGDIENQSRETLKEKQGFWKIERGAHQALKDGYAYIWIDTCCIDKSSSTELSETINSMSDWYRSSGICYAYLADTTELSRLGSSRWFARGWTLQELIMPSKVKFYSAAWVYLGSRTAMATAIADITGIDRRLLSMEERCLSDAFEHLLHSFNVATRMAWARNRKTTRLEDAAYCLMGIFDVNMPLLYGEGKRAFQRLQMEIVKKFNDTSILAFTSDSRSPMLLATSSADFQYILPPVWLRGEEQPKLRVEETHVELDIWLCPSTSSEFFYGIFDCSFMADYLSRPAILLRRLSADGGLEFLRFRQDVLFRISPGKIEPIGSGDIDRLSGPVGLVLDNAKRTRITLKPQSRRSDMFTLPAVRWQLETQGSLLRCRLERSEPPSDRNMMLHHPKCDGALFDDKPAAHGMASFVVDDDLEQQSRFLVVWGERRYRTNPPDPWCRVLSLQQIKGNLRYFPSDLRERWADIDAEACVQALFEPFEPNRVALTRMIARGDMPPLDRVKISLNERSFYAMFAQVSATTFLGRTIFILDIHLGLKEYEYE